jgi:hypothetical protein
MQGQRLSSSFIKNLQINTFWAGLIASRKHFLHTGYLLIPDRLEICFWEDLWLGNAPSMNTILLSTTLHVTKETKVLGTNSPNMTFI